MKQFDVYEFAGVLAPGATILYGFCILYPQLSPHIDGKDFTFGNLGVFVILAYVAGQLIQALGNAIEWVWWRIWGGWPTEWPRKGKGHILSSQQCDQLKGKIRQMLSLGPEVDPFTISEKDWMAVTRQVDANVYSAERRKRIEIFNALYGLNRGIAAALLTLLIVTLFSRGFEPRMAIGLLVSGICVALYRMHRFGRHYAMELFVQFLAVTHDKEEGQHVS